MSTTDTRAAFEYWFSDEGAHPKAIERSSSGGYILAAASSAWNVWQAATEAAKATGTAGEQDGWKTVPRKMTDEQAKETAYNINRKYKVAGPLSDFLVRQIWEFGIYASPNPPAEAARQPAPVVSNDLRNAAQLIMDLYDDMRMGKQAIPAFDALRAALAATAAPVLSDEQIDHIAEQQKIWRWMTPDGRTCIDITRNFARALLTAAKEQP